MALPPSYAEIYVEKHHTAVEHPENNSTEPYYCEPLIRDKNVNEILTDEDYSRHAKIHRGKKRTQHAPVVPKKVPRSKGTRNEGTQRKMASAERTRAELEDWDFIKRCLLQGHMNDEEHFHRQENTRHQTSLSQPVEFSMCPLESSRMPVESKTPVEHTVDQESVESEEEESTRRTDKPETGESIAVNDLDLEDHDYTGDIGMACFVFICCCWPFGLIALITAAIGACTKKHRCHGFSWSETSRWFSHLGIGCGIAIIIGIIVVKIYATLSDNNY